MGSWLGAGAEGLNQDQGVTPGSFSTWEVGWAQVLRDSIRIREVKPALLPGEAEDSDETPQSVMLTVVVLRHFEAMIASWLPLSSEPSPAAAKHQSEVSWRCTVCPWISRGALPAQDGCLT